MNKLLRVLLLCGLAIAGNAVAETITVAIGAAASSLQGITSAEFAKRLQEKLVPEHQVKYYADGQLGDEKELVQKLRLGTVNFTLVSSYMSSITPEFGLFDMPFVVKDRAHVLAIDRELVQTTLAPTLLPKGVGLISTWRTARRPDGTDLRVRCTRSSPS